MKRIGVLAGTGFYTFSGLENPRWDLVGTRYKDLEILHGNMGDKRIFFVPRHGRKHTIPPHKVNFKANVEALSKKNVDVIIGINSVGSLREDIHPGTLVIPDDYICFYRVDTFHDHDVMHVTPSLDEGLRKGLIKAAKKLDMKIVDHGVYFQTLGPRLETRAEVNMIKDHAHIVGMNMASEAVLCQEAGIPFANISSVDNMAHGLGIGLEFEDIMTMSEQNHDKTRQLLKGFLEAQE